MKTYTNRSNAVRAAKSQFGTEYEASVKVMLAVDGKGFNLIPCATLAAPAALVAPVEEEDNGNSIHGYTIHGLLNCPRCNIHLSNGVMDYDSLCEDNTRHAAWLLQAKMWSCMGCGHEFGDDIAEPGKKAASVATGTGIKIQKDRPEANGIKRPSAGGACAAIWDFCDGVKIVTGVAPTAKEIKTWATGSGANPNNAVIEFYQWRKFHGIVGRAPKA